MGCGVNWFDVEVNINPNRIVEAVQTATAAADLGAEMIGVWDSPALYTDPWVTLGALAGSVEVPIGVAVTNPVTRHLVVTANAIASLSEVARNGVFLGVGTGDSGVYNLHGTAARLHDLRTFVTAIRELLENGRTRVDGQDFYVTVRPNMPVPIYVAAHGRRSLELGAELADGLFVGLGYSRDVVEPVLDVVHDVAERSGRDAHTMKIWWNSGGIHIDPIPGRALARSAWLLASLSHHFARFGLEGKFVPDKYRDGIMELGHSYRVRSHGKPSDEEREHYVALATRLGVRDYLADRFLVAGTPQEVRERLRELVSAGAKRFELGTYVGGFEEIRPVLELAQDISETV
jgi:5,10-methylenetetrahydromethanopterin reductase